MSPGGRKSVVKIPSNQRNAKNVPSNMPIIATCGKGRSSSNTKPNNVVTNDTGPYNNKVSHQRP